MADERPLPEDLPVVGDDEVVIRFVHPSHYTDRLESSCLRSKEWKGKPDAVDYGPSVYLASVHDVAALEAANPPWARHGVVRLTVRDLRTVGLTVRRSAVECDFPAIRDAHASLFGITVDNRDSVVTLFGRHIERRPVPLE